MSLAQCSAPVRKSILCCCFLFSECLTVCRVHHRSTPISTASVIPLFHFRHKLTHARYHTVSVCFIEKIEFDRDFMIIFLALRTGNISRNCQVCWHFSLDSCLPTYKSLGSFAVEVVLEARLLVMSRSGLGYCCPGMLLSSSVFKDLCQLCGV